MIRGFLVAALLIVGFGSAALMDYNQVQEAARQRSGEWCGCLAGPKACGRPCQGCCGGDEALCFSGMDPSARGCHARQH